VAAGISYCVVGAKKSLYGRSALIDVLARTGENQAGIQSMRIGDRQR
jgi:hypothetical protein